MSGAQQEVRAISDHRPTSFLLSGPGLIGKRHAELIAERPDCELRAIVAPDAEINRSIAAGFGAAFFTTVEAALDAEPIDVAVISAPNEFHFDQSSTCIERGIPVLVEKPMTDRIETARDLAELARARGVPVLVGHHRTHSTLLASAETFMASQDFGRLVALQGSALFYKPADYFLEGPWRTEPGGGPILINLIHEIGLMRHFGGEIAEVVAIARNDIRGFKVEDTVTISLAFRNGALGTFILSDSAASSKSWEMTSGENAAYPHHPDDYCYHFAGTNGSLDFPSMRARTYAGGREASWWLPFTERRLDIARSDPLALQLAHLVDIVRGVATPLVSAMDGYRNMLVVDAIMQSIRSGKVVPLDPVPT